MSLGVYCVKLGYDSFCFKTSPFSLYQMKTSVEKTKMFINFMLNVIFGVIAAVVAWRRNKDEHQLLRILITLIAFLFGGIYMLYILAAGLVIGNSGQKENFLNKLAETANLTSQQTGGFY